MKPARIAFEHHWIKTRGKRAKNDLQRHPQQPQTYISDAANRHWITFQAALQYVASNDKLNLEDWEQNEL